MPNTPSPYIERASIASEQTSVEESEDASGFERGVPKNPCAGRIDLSATRDRPQEGVVLDATDLNGIGLSFQYKVEGGSYQDSDTITGLSEGIHTFYARGDDIGCEETVEKEVIHCDISLSVSATDEEYDLSNGEITATASTSSSNQVEWSFDGGPWQIGADTQTWTGLDDGTYTVKARDEWGCVASKDVTIGNVEDVYPPTAPTSLTATENTASISLGWDASTDDEVGISHYKVYRSTNSGFTADASTLVKNNVTSTSWDDSDVTGNTYYYKVTAVDERDNESSPSGEVSITFTDSPPSWENREDVLWLIDNDEPRWDSKGDIEANRQAEWTVTDNYIYDGEPNNKSSWDFKADLFADAQPDWDGKADLVAVNTSAKWTATDNYTYTS